MSTAERQEIIEHRNELLPATVVTPLEMLARAVDRGVDADTLQKLMDLKDRHEAGEARKAYVKAMAAFKAEPLSVKKDQEVGYGNTSYTHASLAAVVDAVVAALSKHGLSHRWETKQDGEQITVSCIITHELGHCEHTTLSAGPDKSGSKNAIQAVGSTVTYLQRYTLMAATGLAAHEMDDDARGASPAETLSAAMIEQIEKLIVEVKADRPKFLKWAKAESIEAIPAKSYAACVRMLEKKRKQ